MKKLTLPLLAAIALIGVNYVLAADKSVEKTEKPKPYPLKVCSVSDEKLGEMGDPFVFAYKGQEVKLCCSHCKKDFDKDPAKFMKKIEDAAKAEAAKKKQSTK
jgi:YHS domain-containing protein